MRRCACWPDADQLSAALWAILQNAVEAADDPTMLLVTLSVETGPTRSPSRSPIPAAPPPGAGGRDLSPFMTTKPTGSGVGLALARQILRGHGGEVTLAHSTPEETLFRFHAAQTGQRGHANRR